MCRNLADLARAELLEAVSVGSPDLQRVSNLVDTLLASNLPFKEQLLGGGPWQVDFQCLSPIFLFFWG